MNQEANVISSILPILITQLMEAIIKFCVVHSSTVK